MPAIRFEGGSYDIEPGQDLLSALIDQEAPIQYLCLSGSCGTCRVQVIAGTEHLDPANGCERSQACGGPDGHRLACQAIWLGTGDVELRQLGL